MVSWSAKNHSQADNTSAFNKQQKKVVNDLASKARRMTKVNDAKKAKATNQQGNKKSR